MTEEELGQGFVTLNQLAESEYRENLSELLSGSQSGLGDPTVKVARLIGVLLKQPYAVPRNLDRPSGHSRAYRTWQLVDAPAFDNVLRTECWQSEVMRCLADE